MSGYVNLNVRADEEGSLIVQADFTDDEGNAVAPATAQWKLTDETGTVINSRSAVAISSPESTEYIVLSGNDLALQSASDRGRRILTLEWTYYSTRAAATLPQKSPCRFTIENYVGVT